VIPKHDIQWRPLSWKWIRSEDPNQEAGESNCRTDKTGCNDARSRKREALPAL